jgi:hypothetical protein
MNLRIRPDVGRRHGVPETSWPAPLWLGLLAALGLPYDPHAPVPGTLEGRALDRLADALDVSQGLRAGPLAPHLGALAAVVAEARARGVPLAWDHPTRSLSDL